MFLMMAIAVISLGLTIYYFSTDNEAIYIKSSYMVINKDEKITIDNLLEFKNKNDGTSVKYTLNKSGATLSFSNGEPVLTSGNEGLLSFTTDGVYCIASVGGEDKIVVTTSNRSYSHLVIDVLVCDGTEEYPYIIKTEEDLAKIGRDGEQTYLANCHYKLGNNITLTNQWEPIPYLSGTFDGNHFTLSNMQVVSNKDNVGFIGEVKSSGIIKNLFLKDIAITVTNATNVGTIAGKNCGLVQTSEVTGSVKMTGDNTTSYVGGVVGSNIYDGKRAYIDRCGFEGEIVLASGTSTQYGGGVAGQNNKSQISESYYRTSSNKSVQNGQNGFGGVVGLNLGDRTSANIYDTYFYCGNTNLTNFIKFGGIIFENKNNTINNIVLGNYYGGTTSIQNACYRDEGEAQTDSIFVNKYLADFTNEKKFVTAIPRLASQESRYWNFASVWEMDRLSGYPLLDVYSSIGSSYIIDISDLVGENDITTAEQLWSMLYNNPQNEKSINIIGVPDLVNGGYSIDFTNFVWGDASHPLPTNFKGVLSSSNGCVLRNLKIYNNTQNGNVGLVQELEADSSINGIAFDNVEICGVDGGNYVGVLAGVDYGANINEVKIHNVKVSITGFAFGGLCGTNYRYEGNGVKNVTIKDIHASNKYFVYAGGVIGCNRADITATTSKYNLVENVELYANICGGCAGINAGKISYTTINFVEFNKTQDENTILNLYSGNKNASNTKGVYVGGVAGNNNGDIYDVNVNATIKAETGANYTVYTGGVAGNNTGKLTRVYARAIDITITNSHSSYDGGLVGYNTGKIANSVVDNASKIETFIVSNVVTAKDGNVYKLNNANCSVVGGLVGYDALTSDSTYSIYQSVSNARSIKGYYAGGLAGIALGRIEFCSCGLLDKTNGNVSITGFLAGGLAGVIGHGFVKDCYTICKLTSVAHGGQYQNVLSVVNMEVSATAGFAVFVLKDATLRGCYCVCKFAGQGVSYGSTADISYYGSLGKVIGNLYQNEGSVSTSCGIHLEELKLKGKSGADGFSAFYKYIGSENINVWSTKTYGQYPTLEGVEVRNPKPIE